MQDKRDKRRNSAPPKGLLIMKAMATMLGAAILCSVAGAASAGVAFTDFGPSHGYDTAIGDALAFGLNPGGISPGYEFTAGQGGVVNGIPFAGSYAAASDVVVSLWGGSGFATELGSWDAILPGSAGVVSVSLSGSPVTLVKGQAYLFQINADGGTDSDDFWYANSTGATGTLLDGGENPGVTLGAFEVDVASTPEPASWALMLAGVAGLGAALRSRAERTRRPWPA
jgi:hypothetical protein